MAGQQRLAFTISMITSSFIIVILEVSPPPSPTAIACHRHAPLKLAEVPRRRDIHFFLRPFRFDIFRRFYAAPAASRFFAPPPPSSSTLDSRLALSHRRVHFACSLRRHDSLRHVASFPRLLRPGMRVA